MSLKGLIAGIWTDKVNVIKSVPAIYGAGLLQPIFAITGGPVYITGIIEYCDTALVGATTTHVTIGGGLMDAALLALGAAAADTFVVSPLGNYVKLTPGAAIAPMPTLLALVAATLTFGVVAGPGQNIEWGFAGVAMAAGELVSLIVMYRKLAPASLIS